MNRWKQKHFYISTFKALPHSTGATLEDFRKIVRANREAGINLIENAIMSREEGLQAAEACELEQVPFLIQNITADKGFSGMGSNCPPVTTELVKELAEEQKERRYLEGYFLWDEMSTDNFPYCREVCDRFRQEVPDKLAYTLILPSYGAYWWDASGGDWQNSGYAQYVRDYIRVVDPDVISFDYYPFDVHITIQPWSPLQYGFFEGVFLGNEKFEALNTVIHEVAQAHGVRDIGIAIAWLLRLPEKMQPIVGSISEKRLEDIAAASEITLTRQEWYAIYRAAGYPLP